MSRKESYQQKDRLTTPRTVSPTEKMGRAGWKRELLLSFLLIAIAAIAYSPALKGGFIWDDDAHLTQNPCIVGPLGLKEIWTTRAARICPLVQTTFWVEHKIWGLNPLPYHVVNTLMHAAGAVVLWQVLRALRIRGAWLGAAVWALHPVQVETVAWITELKNTQSCFFYLLAILFFVKSEAADKSGNPERSYWRYGLSFGFGALAMASKSSTVVLPVVLGLASWWINKQFNWRAVRKIAPFLLLSAAASLLSIWTQHLEGANEPEYARSVLERIIVAGKVVWFYLGKLAWPHPLVFIYPRWQIDPSRVISYLPIIAVCAVFVICWCNRNGKLRPIFFAFAYFLVALFPVLGLLDHYFLRYSFVGDHFQYLASIGPLALAAAGIAIAFDVVRKRAIPQAILSGTLLVVLGTMTWKQCAMYANSETLWRATIARNSRCWMALNNLGALLRRTGRLDEAIARLQEALKIKPDYAEAHNNLGSALGQSGRVTEAISQYQRALEIKPVYASPHINLGVFLLQANRLDESLTHLQLAVQIEPDNADAQNDLGNTLLQMDRTDEAITHYEKAVELRLHQTNGEQAVTNYNLANAFSRAGRFDEAISHYRQALQFQPDYAQAYVDLGLAYLAEHKFADVIGSFQRALQLDPRSVLVQNNLAWQLATCPERSLRDGPRALELAEQANRASGGENPAILNTLAAAYAQNGQFPKAIETAQTALRLIGPNDDPALVEVIRHSVALYQTGSVYQQP